MKSKIQSWGTIIFITVLLCEGVSRYFISFSFNTPLFQPQKIIYNFYPELLSIPDTLDSATTNVLVLGGSGVSDVFCNTSKNLQRELNNKGKDVNVYNLAEIAHTSFDSRSKFNYCKKIGFDYVFVYDGINDTRVNNCPNDIFREDYSHIHFYSQIGIFESHPEINYFTLPFLLHYQWNEMIIKIGWKKTIPKEYFVMNQKLMPTEMRVQSETLGTEGYKAKKLIEQYQDKIVFKDKRADNNSFTNIDSLWWENGNNIKSTISFRNNILSIYKTKSPKTKLILATYAWHQPEDYSLQNFLHGRMDYAEQRFPTELYGKPENVVKGLLEHNLIIDSIANSNSDIIYFNFNDSIPHNSFYFNDICHLADSGKILLSRILAEKIATR